MNKKKWLSISTSRNDGDIFESFVRSNATFIDKFIVLDDSTDNTPEICKNLRKEGYDIEFLQKPGIIADQKAKTNWMFRKFADQRKYSAVVPLDIDEVLIGIGGATSKEQVSLGPTATFLDWIPFAPTSSNPFLSPDPLRSNFRSTLNTRGRVKKIFIPGSVIDKQATIHIGAHNYTTATQPTVLETNHHLALAHFPARTEDQMFTKLLTGLAAVRLKPVKVPGESMHLVEIAKILMQGKGNFDLKLLQRIAAFYGFLSETTAEEGVLFGNSEIVLPRISNRYQHLSEVNLNVNVYNLVMELTAQLVKSQGIKTSADKKYIVK